MANSGFSPLRASLSLSLPVIPLLVTGLIHFVFSALAQVALDDSGYLYCHLVLLLISIWSTRDREGLEPVISYIIVLLTSGLYDILLLAELFDGLNAFSWGRFSISMIIINLLLKPLTFLLSIVVLYLRLDGHGINFLRRAKDSYNKIGGGVEVERGEPAPAPPGEQ